MTGPTYLAEPYTNVTYLDVEEVPTLVRATKGVAPHEMGGIFDETFTALVRGLGQEQMIPGGPAFALHHEQPGATMTFDAGFPMAEILDGEFEAGGITFYPSRLPAGRIATISHMGPYDGLAQAWQSLMEHIAADGHTTRLPFWEVYVTAPGTIDPNSLRTNLVTLLAD